MSRESNGGCGRSYDSSGSGPGTAPALGPRRGGAGPVRDLPGGKTSPALAGLASSHLVSFVDSPCSGRRRSPRHRGAGARVLREDVVVTGGGLIPGDHGRRVERERPLIVDAAPDTLAVAAATAARAAVGVVLGDGAAGDGESGACADKDTATGAVAPFAAAPADRQVVAERAVAEADGSAVRDPKGGEA